MSSSDIAILVDGLSKSYTIRHNTVTTRTTMADAFVQRVKHPLRRNEREEFWALHDLSMEVGEGEVVGIIGRNGAGKSTLLKILSQITVPTAGRVDIYGRIGSLLEVGTGFHPELTGRENIYLNGAILGMKRREITRQFEAIVDFAGVEQFLDTPVKRYSSGMYVRLAFAVAAHLSTEILLVDEVLSVGDGEFQRKCLGKMHDVARAGRTILFVSHAMTSVASLCTRGILLDQGRVAYEGNVSSTIDRYVSTMSQTPTDAGAQARRSGSGQLRFTAAAPTKDMFDTDEPKVIEFALDRLQPTGDKAWIACHVTNDRGDIILQCDSRLVDYWIDPVDTHDGRFVLNTPWLRPGGYNIDLYICSNSMGIVDEFERACRLEVRPVLPYPVTTSSDGFANGVVFADFAYQDGRRRRPLRATRRADLSKPTSEEATGNGSPAKPAPTKR
jgi:lipopolysaccharide transport system ATP-binding protein